jgi:iron complex outermembrane recepter protein
MTITTSGDELGRRVKTPYSRLTVSVFALVLALQWCIRTAEAADALDRPIRIDIAANSALEDALIEWGAKAGVTIMINTSVVDRHLTPEIHGTLSARKALSILLQDSGLSYTQEGERIHIVPSVTRVRSALRHDDADIPTRLSSGYGTTTDSNDNNNRSESGALSKDDADHGKGLAEVIVTAEKYAERIQDVPIPVTAISAESLTENNQVKITDYYTQVPGLTISPAIESTQLLAIRGITTGGLTTATVGVLVDDMPFGATRITNVPDLDPGDLARIEVLRGPQGTLYGASSMGGLIKFVTRDPSTDGISGRVEAGTDSVYNGAEMGYAFRGSLNLPLSDDLAIRASAFTRQDPGYIDNPTLGIEGINKDRTSGGRLAVLWKPSESFSLKFSALYQDTRGDGLNYVDPSLGNWRQEFIRGVGPYNRRAQAYGVILTDKIGNISVTALSGYNVNDSSDSFDATSFFGSATQSIFGVTGTPALDYTRTSKLSQEIRVDAPIGGKIDMLVGAFYTHEYTQTAQAFLATDPLTGVVAGVDSYGNSPLSYLEYAAFADLTYRVTDRVDVQLGGRQSHIQQVQGTQTSAGGFYGASPIIVPAARETDTPTTYLLTPRFKISPDLMIYARVASGYRPGGVNAAPPFIVIPPKFNSDKTQDYEIGAKGDLLGGVLSFDSSVYYINWKDIQLALLTAGGLQYTGNAGAAKSQGVELSLDARPMRGLKVSGWVAYSDAEITQAFPLAAVEAGTYGVVGDRLPYSARLSGNLLVHEEVPLASQTSGFAEASASYVAGRQDVFTNSPQRQYLPPYARIDLRSGVTYQSWKVNAYVNNVANRLGVISGGVGNFPPNYFFYIQPRTVGVSVSREF